MTNGVIFDIKEFSVHDGPGIRITHIYEGMPALLHVVPQPRGAIFRAAADGQPRRGAYGGRGLYS